MKIEMIEGACLVSRGDGPRCPRESTFWYWLQRELNSKTTQPGLRWYRIRPHKIAMTGMPFALRQGRDAKRNAAIIDNYYALRCLHEQYNDGLTVRLQRMTLEGA